MQSTLAASHDRVSSPVSTESRLLWRLGGVFVVLVVEVLLISSQAEHLAFQGAHGLAGLLFLSGPWKIRIPITFAVVSSLFWQVRGRPNVQRILGYPLGGVEWRWLGVHAIAISVFAWRSLNLLNHPPQGALLNAVIVLCLAMGGAAVVSCALAFLPGRLWREILRGTEDVWAYVLALGLGACVASLAFSSIWLPLTRGTLFLAGAMLHPFVPRLVIDTAARTLGTASFTLEVAPACSGYEGIGLMLAFTSAYLWFLRREWRFPRALLLIPIGVGAMWLSNAVRVAGLVAIGCAGAPDIAMNGFHSHVGWIFFNLVALASCVAARQVSWLTTAGRTVERGPAKVDQNPVAAYLMPFLAVLAVGMLAGAASAGFEWLYPARVVVAAAALWYFRHTYRRLDWHAGWLAPAAGAAVFALWIGLERFSGGARGAEPVALAQASVLARNTWIALRVFGAVVTVPIAEELAFRGYLLRRLASADFESVAWRTFQWLPFLISSLAFGVLHGERWLAGTLAGMIYALVLMRNGKFGEAVIAHGTTNALLAAWVLSTGQWQLW